MVCDAETLEINPAGKMAHLNVINRSLDFLKLLSESNSEDVDVIWSRIQ